MMAARKGRARCAEPPDVADVPHAMTGAFDADASPSNDIPVRAAFPLWVCKSSLRCHVAKLARKAGAGGVAMTCHAHALPLRQPRRRHRPHDPFGRLEIDRAGILRGRRNIENGRARPQFAARFHRGPRLVEARRRPPDSRPPGAARPRLIPTASACSAPCTTQCVWPMTNAGNRAPCDQARAWCRRCSRRRRP